MEAAAGPATRAAHPRAGALLLATALGAVLFHWTHRWLAPAAPYDARPLLAAAAPAASWFSEKEGAPPRWTALTPGPGGARVPVGAVLSSGDVAPDVRGYAGPVPVLVGLAPDGTITGVALAPHHETPAYADRLEQGRFLQQFTGRRASDRFELERDLDGVTRATVTATAVAEGVRRTARAGASGVYGLSVPPETRQPAPLPWLKLGAVAAALLVGLAAHLLRFTVLRWASVVVSAALLGFWQSTWLSAQHLAGALLWRWPPLRAHAAWYLLFGVAVACALLWRNLYCARLCPFGALQELAHALSPWRIAGSADEDRRARRLRVAFLWLATVAVFAFGAEGAAGYEPFGTAFDRQGGLLRQGLLAAVLVLAAVRHRPWCRYFCPTGTCLQLLGRMKTTNPFDAGPEPAGPAGERTPAGPGFTQ